MSDSYVTTLAPQVERARKILQHEQRTNHQDRVIRPGGIVAFTVRWYEEASSLCKNAGLDLEPIHRFVEHLEGYNTLDPMQRAASLRAALSVLNEMEKPGDGSVNTDPTAPALARPRKAPVKKAEQAISSPVPKAAVRPVTPTKIEAVQPVVEQEQTKNILDIPNPIRLEAGMSHGHTSLTLLSADITAVPGVGPTVAKRLYHLGIRTVRDLLFYFPREHRDYSKLVKIAQVPFNELTTTMGLIWEVKSERTRNGRSRTVARISDETGDLHPSWFNQGYLQKQLQMAKGEFLVVTGTKNRFGNRVEFSVRSHELPERGDLLNTGRLVPIYALTEGLHAKTLLRFTKYVVDRYAQMVPEHLPMPVRSAGQLIMLPEAVTQIHYPDNEEIMAAARRRLAFDELFLIQLGMQERRARWQYEAPKGNAFAIHYQRIFIDPPTQDANAEQPATPENSEIPAIGATLWSTIASDKPLEETLPFSFTGAQRRVICEIFADLAKERPMCRLLQGDVGAGKTAVAAAALFQTALNGYQGAIMAPTELLAEQHARSIGKMLEPFGIRTVLLTGSMRTRERALSRAALESGEAAIAVGTHALIQDDVIFARLGLVIVDEQHRFGVEQRDALRQKGYHPHMLVMTATPIPRTLALTLYGDLDVSVIDQLPPGRQKIITRWRTGAQRREAYSTIKEQVAEGRQAFIICPLIEESEVLEAKAAVTEHARLQKEVFPKLRLALLHGAMKPAEKDQIMHSFRNKEMDILVATSVIEVGIDIPNATVIVIEDADRFGLSQLHQFRGRVGRGQYQSYSYVLSADASIQSQDRLGVFQETDDGFKLAEEDLRLRGPGDFIGVRQSGMPELKIADLNDTSLIELSKRLAIQLWESDPYLRKSEHIALREKMRIFWQTFMAH